MNRIEALAALLIVLNVVLLARRSVWNYPVAICGVALYAVVFRDARLYSDMALQGFFIVLNLYGWITWSRVRAEQGDVVPETIRPEDRARWIAGCGAAILGWGLVMHRYTDAALPWWDAAIAIGSAAAQIMLARRKLENWLVWIAVDAAAIGLYAVRGLWATAALYVLLLGLAWWGWRDWRAVWRRHAEPAPVGGVVIA